MQSESAMPKRYSLVLPCLFLLSVFVLSVAFAGMQNQSYSANQYIIEDLYAYHNKDNNTLIVSGVIKNNSYSSVAGEVNVYLMEKTGNLAHAFKGDVNKGHPFSHGAKGFFEVVINIGNMPPLQNVNIEFIPLH